MSRHGGRGGDGEALGGEEFGQLGDDGVGEELVGADDDVGALAAQDVGVAGQSLTASMRSACTVSSL